MFPHFSSHSAHVPQFPVVKHWPLGLVGSCFNGSGLGGSGSGTCCDDSGAAIGTEAMKGASVNVGVGNEDEVSTELDDAGMDELDIVLDAWTWVITAVETKVVV